MAKYIGIYYTYGQSWRGLCVNGISTVNIIRRHRETYALLRAVLWPTGRRCEPAALSFALRIAWWVS